MKTDPAWIPKVSKPAFVRRKLREAPEVHQREAPRGHPQWSEREAISQDVPREAEPRGKATRVLREAPSSGIQCAEAFGSPPREPWSKPLRVRQLLQAEAAPGTEDNPNNDLGCHQIPLLIPLMALVMEIAVPSP